MSRSTDLPARAERRPGGADCARQDPNTSSSDSVELEERRERNHGHKRRDV